MPSSLKLRHGLMVVTVASLLIFQNCAQPPEENFTATAQSFQSKLPLAVSATLDTIAHMSCSEIKDAVEPRAYFTFRAGAYVPNMSGMELTKEFRDATKFYSTTQRARAFASSEVNGNTLFNLSIRAAADYQSPWISEELRVGEEIEAFLPPLDSDVISGPLAGLPLGKMINYFPGPHPKRLIEASLRFYKFENVVKDTRNNLSSRTSLLVAGYSGSSDELDTTLRSPPDAAASPGGAHPIYGRGYFLSFRLPQGYTSGETRALASVEEVDLQTSFPTQINATWDCNSDYQFVIVRPEDVWAGRVICNPTVDRYNDTNQQQMLSAIRRVLRVEDWFVDLNNRCVMPKRTGDYCYGELNNRTIQYGSATCVNNTSFMCPHFVSVCIRR